jgi:hypothetical protein
MRQPQISDQGYLEPPITRDTTSILGQLVPTSHAYACTDMDMNN